VDVLRIGYDPALAAFGPGNVLWMRLIRDSFERGDRVLDLGPETFHYQTGHDSLSYKRFWCNRIQPTVRCLHYSLSPRAQALRLARWFGRRLQKRRDARTGTLSGDRSSNSASTQAVMEHAEP
jgi:CelD/BcsL family acetyltransferase involved in cellulose biosynthesis